MSDVKVARYLLAHYAPLLAQVPSPKIKAGPITEGTTLPAIGISHISTIRRQSVKKGAHTYCTSRVQVMVYAATYAMVKNILALVRDALPRTRGTVNGVLVDDILPDIEGPDFENDEATIYMQSQDFKITFNE